MNTFDFSKNEYNNRLDKNRDHYDGTGERNRIKIVVDLIKNSSNNKILDVGCYDGSISSKFLINNNIVYGIDASSDAVLIANNKGIKASVANLEEGFLFEDNFFDIVFMGEVIEHILDTDFFISEIRRVLKPGGEIIITTPNVASIGRRIMLLFGYNPFFEASFTFPKYPSVGHIRYFTKKLLIDFLKEKGFETINFKSYIINFPFGIKSTLLANFFPSLGMGLVVKSFKK